MSLKSDPDMGINSWLEDELYQQYLHDRTAVGRRVEASVRRQWRAEARRRPRRACPERPPRPSRPPATSSRCAAPPDASRRTWRHPLAIPLATSQRTIAVKVMDENRRIINQHRTLVGRSKVSYTHIIGWAVVKALEHDSGDLNYAYAEKDGQPYRVVRPQMNLGVAVDVAGKDGGRSLLVPNIKNAGALSFAEYLAAFDDLVARARAQEARDPRISRAPRSR